ncbi:hypothetical protein [Natronococcus wangiae]|uniref:hypothetical protein n=1 Tax=Natronococcus wangiae TaxID=3068275 RepID=UPI00273F2F24|nr:hypothetical protein [Natronococcus sp. AD5]
MTEHSRRAFIATMGTTSLGLTGSAAAERDWENDGDEITRTDDLDELREYMPYLAYSRGSESRDQLIGLYGWKAESPDHDTDAYSYWARYTNQNAGLEELGITDRVAGLLASDAHLWDHEPSITFVNPDTGDVEEVVYTKGHHSVGVIEKDIPLINGTNVSLEVVDPWHHYTPDDDKEGVDVTNFAEFGSFLDHRERWEEVGFYENSKAEAIDNPWTARKSDTWFESRRDRYAAMLWGFL